MTTDFRALCAELVQAFKDLRDSSHGVFGLHLNGDLAPWDELIEGGRFEDWLEVFARARAALADKPAVPEGREPVAVIGELSDKRPTVMEIVELSSEIEAAELGQVDFARAVLARWGNPAPQPPADGEVAELTAWLRMQGEAQKPGPKSLLSTKTKKEMHANGSRLIRAAELLQRQVMVPVNVSERLPGPGDCDAEGRCWWWYPSVPDKTYGYWAHEDDAIPERAIDEQPTHWLSAHALPLPEVK